MDVLGDVMLITEERGERESGRVVEGLASGVRQKVGSTVQVTLDSRRLRHDPILGGLQYAVQAT